MSEKMSILSSLTTLTFDIQKALQSWTNFQHHLAITVVEAKARFFTETHEKFVESVPQLLKKLLDEKIGHD